MTVFHKMDWLRPSLIALIAANAVPVLGVLVWDWKVFPILLLFWVENVIVGGFNVLRLMLAAPDQPWKWLAKLFFIPFFCIHYGIFCIVHGIFVIGLFGGGFQPHGCLSVEWILRLISYNHLWWAVAGLTASHALSFAVNYIGAGEFRRVTLEKLMKQPYRRVVVLHLTILGGGALVALSSPQCFIYQFVGNFLYGRKFLKIAQYIVKS